jgi:sarcosine oxidase, subunit gamma
MASTDRISPLSGWTTRFERASSEPAHFSIREQLFASQINLRVKGDDATRVNAVLGAPLPIVANTWSGPALWLGPDEWLVASVDETPERLAGALRGSLDGVHHSVVDVSANRTIIEIGGTDARTVLAKGCPLDLQGGAFGAGQCAQSLLAKSQVILQCVDARPTFRLFVRISFASYVAEWLLDAAAELTASRAIGMVGLRL